MNEVIKWVNSSKKATVITLLLAIAAVLWAIVCTVWVFTETVDMVSHYTGLWWIVSFFLLFFGLAQVTLNGKEYGLLPSWFSVPLGIALTAIMVWHVTYVELWPIWKILLMMSLTVITTVCRVVAWIFAKN